MCVCVCISKREKEGEREGDMRETVNGLASAMIFMCLLIECQRQALPGATSLLAEASLLGGCQR